MSTTNYLDFINAVNIKNTAYAPALAAVYSEDTEYAAGDIVMYDNIRYKCLEATTGEFDKTKWQVENIKTSLDLYKSKMLPLIAQKADQSDIVDNLTTVSTDHPLSANMGSYINENVNWQVNIVNNITTASTTQPLSANMGKYLWEGVPQFKAATFLTTWEKYLTCQSVRALEITSAYGFRLFKFDIECVVAEKIPANKLVKISSNWTFDGLTPTACQAIPWSSASTKIGGSAILCADNEGVYLYSSQTIPYGLGTTPITFSGVLGVF